MVNLGHHTVYYTHQIAKKFPETMNRTKMRVIAFIQGSDGSWAKIPVGTVPNPDTSEQYPVPGDIAQTCVDVSGFGTSRTRLSDLMHQVVDLKKLE